MTIEISEFKKLVAPDILPCPDPIVNREVVSIIMDFCKKTNILTRDFELDVDSDNIDDEMQNSIDFDISGYAHDLRPTTLLRLLVNSDEYIPYKRNIQNTIENFDSTHVENWEGHYKYFWIPENDIIRLFDMSSDDSYVWMKVALKPLRTATKVPEFLFEDWSEAIVAGTKWKILSMPGKDWSDPRAAAFYRSEWRKYLSQAKRQSVKGGSGGFGETINWKSFGSID
jgi:hypothetical protein